MSEPLSLAPAVVKYRDFPSDVKEFLLTFPRIATYIQSGRDEMLRCYQYIDTAVASQPWFNANDLRTSANDWRVFQITANSWSDSVRPGCPTIHLEYGLIWEPGYVETCLDVERNQGVPWSTVQTVARRLAAGIIAKDFRWMKGNGWILEEKLRDNRMLIHNRTPCDVSTLSVEWFVDNALRRLNQLADTIPIIHEVVAEMFTVKLVQL